MRSGRSKSLGVWRQLSGGRVAHRFEPVMLVLTLLVIPVVIIEESEADHWVKDIAAVVNWLIWVGFLAELIFVLWVAPRKRAALRAHWLETGIVVLTPPFLPALLSTLRFARLTRLLRLVRLGALGTRAIRIEKNLTSREGFRYIALLTAFLIATAGAVISIVDAKEFPNVGLGIWWAIVTVTTVGYGDVVPHTVAGRLVGGLLMFVGIGFLSLLTATIASSFVSQDQRREQKESGEILQSVRRIEERLERLEAQNPG